MTRTSSSNMIELIQNDNYQRGNSMPDWASYSVKEAAKKTGYSEQYLRRLIRQGKIESTRIGQVFLIRISSLEEYIAEMEETDDGRAGPKSKV